MGHPSGKRAYLKACGSLQDFIKPSGRSSELMQIPFNLRPSVKDLLESRGIPHTAIFQVRINGQRVPLHQNLQNGDVIVAYPYEEVPSVSVDPIFTRPSAFFADLHLGKLMKVVRLMGFDTQSIAGLSKQEVISRSNTQKRMILTRNTSLLKNSATQYGYWVRSTNPEEQIHELFRRFHLTDQIDPFSRCMECNGILHQVAGQDIAPKIPPKVKEWHDLFFQCENCGRVYWQGSHFKNLKKKVDDLIQQYS